MFAKERTKETTILLVKNDRIDIFVGSKEPLHPKICEYYGGLVSIRIKHSTQTPSVQHWNLINIRIWKQRKESPRRERGSNLITPVDIIYLLVRTFSFGRKGRKHTSLAPLAALLRPNKLPNWTTAVECYDILLAFVTTCFHSVHRRRHGNVWSIQDFVVCEYLSSQTL